jgi:hypothetical protein
MYSELGENINGISNRTQIKTKKTTNRFSEIVCGTVQIFENDDTRKNIILEEIKSRLNSGFACCHLVQKLLSSRLLSKHGNVRICKAIILNKVLSLTIREEHRLEVFKNGVLRIFGQKRAEVTSCIIMNFKTCTLRQEG